MSPWALKQFVQPYVDSIKISIDSILKSAIINVNKHFRNKEDLMEGMDRKMLVKVENAFYFCFRSFYSFGFFWYPFTRLSMSRSL